MDLMMLQHFCGIANKNAEPNKVKTFDGFNENTFCVLQKGDQLYFKDPQNGILVRSYGFLHKYRNKTWEQVESIMVNCGVHADLVKEEIDRERGLLALYSRIRELRSSMHSAVAAGQIRFNSFGDWLFMNKRDFSFCFDHFVVSGVRRANQYAVCITRDEVGIPQSANVHTTFGQFLGRIPLNLVNSAIEIKYSSTIDSVGWNFGSQVICQSENVAVSYNRQLEERQIPVGLIAYMGRNSPHCGNATPPKTYFACFYDEAPEAICNFYGSNFPLFVLRSNTKRTEPFIQQATSVELFGNAKDFFTDLTTFTHQQVQTSQPIDVMTSLLSSPSIPQEAKKAFIHEFCRKNNQDETGFLRELDKLSKKNVQFTSGDRSYFTSADKYYVCNTGGKNRSSQTVLTNFVLDPDGIVNSHAEVFKLFGTIRLESGKECKFEIPLQDLRSPKKAMDAITLWCNRAGLGEVPILTQKSHWEGINNLISMQMNNLQTVIEKRLGFNEFRDTYTSEHWMIEDGDLIKLHKSAQTVTNEMSNDRVYFGKSEDYIQICKTFIDAHKDNDNLMSLISLISAFLFHGQKRGYSTLYVPKEMLADVNEMLGIRTRTEPDKVTSIQGTQTDCSEYFAKKYNIMNITAIGNDKKREMGNFAYRGGHINFAALNRNLYLLPYLLWQVMDDTADDSEFEEPIPIANDGVAGAFLRAINDPRFADVVEPRGHEYIIKTVEFLKKFGELYGVSVQKKRLVQEIQLAGYRVDHGEGRAIRKYRTRTSCIVFHQPIKPTWTPTILLTPDHER